MVATTAGLDQPQKARGIVRRQDGDWLSGRTPRDRAELREGVVRTTVEDLRGLASPLRGAFRAHRAVCVFGSGDIIAKSDAVRGENPLLHSIDLLPASPGASPEAVPAE